jgi:hypothetical protein
MSDVYYWVLAHAGFLPFSKTIYFAFTTEGKSLPTNPALAMRWIEYEDAEQYASHLAASWTPMLVRFEGDALCGGENPSPNSTL